MAKATLRGYLFLIFLFIVQTGFTQGLSFNPDHLYSKDALKADLRFVRKRLEKTHPALYRYTTKSSFHAFFDSLDHAIVRPMTEQGFLSLITLLHAKIRDGHTMFLPSEAAMEYDNSKGRFLPFSVAFTAGKLYIVENCSGDSTIQQGEEILGINGASTSAVMLQLLSRQIRDGNNQTYPEWIVNHYFAAYYRFAFGQPDQFSLELKNTSGELHKKQVMALTKDSIKFFRQTRYAYRYRQTNQGQGIILEENKHNTTAILTIKSFDPDLLQSFYKQDYKHVMDSIFMLLNRNQTMNLILDLRDNQGGDFEPGRYLLSYLFIHPARYLMDGKEAKLIQPKAHHFTGRLFVLINGGSFSSTAIVSANLERDQRAIFIGEETGGNKYIISGNPVEGLLPQTKIRSFISTTTFRIIGGANDGHGILPAYPIYTTIGDILTGNDPSKKLALQLIPER